MLLPKSINWTRKCIRSLWTRRTFPKNLSKLSKVVLLYKNLFLCIKIITTW